VKSRVRYVENDLVLDRQMHALPIAKGRTQLIPLEQYRYRDRGRWRFTCVSAVVYALAMYGFYKLVEPALYYGVTPYLSRLWK
jgi:hypothetical protein